MFLRVLLLAFIFALVFNSTSVESAQSAQVHRVQPGETLYTIAKQYGITVDELEANNGYLRNPNVLFVKQVLIVPAPKVKQKISEQNTYTVIPGDSLYKISQKLGITMSLLIAQNQLNEKDFLRVGQVLIVPPKAQAKTQVQQNAANTYQVKPGDSLYLIAQRLGVTVAKIAEENKLQNWDYLYVGQILKLPAQEAPKEAMAKQPTQQPAPQPSFQYTIAQLARMFSDTFYLRGPAGGAKVALTFDDGPDAQYTGQVLDVLKEHEAQATFFLIGESSQKYSHVVQRIDHEGHVIGNHSWSHPNLAKVEKERLHSEIIQTEIILEKITGKNPALIRPPYGAVSKESIEHMRDLGYKVVNWSVDSIDWRDRDIDQILINTLPGVKDGGIILFHTAGGGQSFAATVSALSEIIYTLKAQGYEFVTVDTLLSVPAYK